MERTPGTVKFMPFHPEMHAAPRAPGYRIEAFLGKGASGLVFKAFDIAGNFYVALKSIRYPEQDDIYRLKQEFRWFCDFLHPNIVELYNLYVDETHCFYTMELIEGLDFVSATSRDADFPAFMPYTVGRRPVGHP